MAWYYILLICIGAVVFLGFALAAIVYAVAFGSRCDKNPLLKYFTAEDYNLSTESVCVKRGKVSLNGYIYRDESAKSNGKLVIFCHGLGPGQIAYTTEINYFCKNGFTVLALDSTGCNLSSGKNIRGMYEGVKTAICAIDFARADKRLSDMPICLVGHSWGGYSVLCAASRRKVEKVVAISSPVSPVKTLYYGAAQKMPIILAAFLCPFIAVIDFFKFGKNSNLNAAKCANRCGAQVLLVHGDSDGVVPMGRSAYGKANGANVQKYLAQGKAHNPYNTVAAQKLVMELFANLSRVKKMSEQERTYFETFDYRAAAEEDGEVMGAIVRFLNN